MNFLVFQHVDVEHPGVFRDFWREAGIRWQAVELDQGEPIPDDLSAFDALVVMGGPMDVWQVDSHPWLVPEMTAIAHFVRDLRRPFLGVCLGHQLLAQALGGHVGLAAGSEVGPTPVELTAAAGADALFAGLPSPLDTFQWHSAEIQRLPEGSVPLARTDLCEVQAFRWGDRAWGLQFHGEITPDTVREWGAIPEYAASLQAALGPARAATLEADVLARLPGYQRTARHFSDGFLSVVTSLRA